LQQDQARLIDINALGVSSINLNVVLRKRKNGAEYFLFEPTVTSIPAMNLTCDTADNGNNYKESCTTFLYLRIPGTERTVVEDKVQLDYPVRAACDRPFLNA
jgi:hypothetical protein